MFYIYIIYAFLYFLGAFFRIFHFLFWLFNFFDLLYVMLNIFSVGTCHPPLALFHLNIERFYDSKLIYRVKNEALLLKGPLFNDIFSVISVDSPRASSNFDDIG